MKDIPFDPYDFFGYLATGLLVLFGLQQVVGVPEIAGKDLKTLDLIVVALAAYVVGQMTATPAKAFLEDLLARRLLRAPSINLMQDRRSPVRGLLFPGYCTPLPNGVRAKILAKATQEGLGQTTGEELFLHIRFRDYVRTDDKLMGRLNGFLNKYGFSRNLSFACLAAGAAILIAKPYDLGDPTVRYGVLGIAAGIMLFYRFLKFYRQYSYELFNAYAGKP
ncbi:MAG TPA: hypothetical protein VHA82_01855 [Ramlibacter sp.]|uniref:hypothetical protein n=1 Tax=Ramlibacter sp. TaxID=1917967 RepID=UPI002B6B91B0|nr:hypothetical protein [Ramlibacter sp.]HVZ42524.1 hypothetical protein [Ramlibacter sp.]